jgi:hypothetical protein
MTAAIISASLSELINSSQKSKRLADYCDRLASATKGGQSVPECVEALRRFETARDRAVSDFKVFDHRVGYRSFGNDSYDVARPRPTRAVKDDRRAGAAALESGEDEAQEVRVPADRRRNFHEAVDQRVRPNSGLPPQARTRRHEPHDTAVALDDDGAQVVLNVFAERVLQRRVGFDEVKAAAP